MPCTVRSVTSPRFAARGSLDAVLVCRPPHLPPRRAPETPLTAPLPTPTRRRSRALALLAAAAGLALGGCCAQPVAGLSREQGEAILAELKDLRRTLAEQRAGGEAKAAHRVQIEDVAAPTLGSAGAPVTLVEFTDYQCPFCKRFHDSTWPELKRRYVDTGKVRYVVRDMPLSFHANALPAALAVHCADAQGQFWALHDALFGLQEELSPQTLRRTALNFGIRAEAYDACLKNPALTQAIELDSAEAERIGVTGTPGFLLATRNGQQLDGVLILGAQPAAVFAARIDALLAGRSP
jgi:protein-disulfide isomerase